MKTEARALEAWTPVYFFKEAYYGSIKQENC